MTRQHYPIMQLIWLSDNNQLWWASLPESDYGLFVNIQTKEIIPWLGIEIRKIFRRYPFCYDIIMMTSLIVSVSVIWLPFHWRFWVSWVSIQNKEIWSLETKLVRKSFTIKKICTARDTNHRAQLPANTVSLENIKLNTSASTRTHSKPKSYTGMKHTQSV